MADDYLRVQEDPDGSRTQSINARIRALSPQDARTFHELLGERNGYTGRDRVVFDAAFEYAAARGLSFLDLKPSDHEAIVREAAAKLEAESAR